MRPDVQVPMFQRIYRVPSYAQAAPGQAESFETLAQIMGGDQTAALYRILVEEKKLASDAGAPMTAMPAMRPNSRVYAVPRPGVSLETLEKAVDQVIQGFTAAPAKPPISPAPRRSLSPRSPIAATANSPWPRPMARR